MIRLHRWIGLLWLLLTIASGCFRHRTDIALLEGELRWMEDQLYTLEDELALKATQLAECRGQQGNCCSPDIIYDGPVIAKPETDADSAQDRPKRNDYEVVPSETDTLRVPNRLDRQVPTLAEPPEYEVLDEGEGDQDGADEGAASDRTRSATPPGLADPYEITTPSDMLSPPDELDDPEPPSISPPPPDASLRRSTPADAAPIQLSSYAEPAPEPEPVHTGEQVADVFITHLWARAWLAHDRGFDGQPGDVDLLVVVEPRNVDGEPVLLGAPLSVVVLDAGQPKESAQVARWDYSASETRRLMQSTSAGRGIHLELQWPKEPAATDQLQVFVRYVTVEDRQLEHDVSVAVQRPEESPMARIGWRSNTRRPPTPPAADDRTKTTRVASGIKLRPIPKDHSDRPAVLESDSAGDSPVILEEERPPQWSPERP